MPNEVVMKFGGMPLENLPRIKVTARYIKKSLVTIAPKIIVTASAMGQTTNILRLLAEDVFLGATSPMASLSIQRELNLMLPLGEILSATLLTMALRDIGVKAISHNAYTLGIETEGGYADAKIISLDEEKLDQALKENDVVVVAGFHGIHENGSDIATLGPSASDLTAVALAAVRGCPCYFYKIGDGGIQAVNPKKVKNPKIIGRISYDDARAMVEYGYMFLQPRCLIMAEKFGVPLEFRSAPGNDADSDKPGTVIGKHKPKRLEGEDEHFSALTELDDLYKLTLSEIPNIPGFSKAFNKALSGIPVVDSFQLGGGKTALMSVFVKKNVLEETTLRLEGIRKEHPGVGLSIIEMTIITYIDSRINPNSTFAMTISEVTERLNINVEYSGSSGNRIHTVVEKSKANQLIGELAKSFDLIEQ